MNNPALENKQGNKQTNKQTKYQTNNYLGHIWSHASSCGKDTLSSLFKSLVDIGESPLPWQTSQNLDDLVPIKLTAGKRVETQRNYRASAVGNRRDVGGRGADVQFANDSLEEAFCSFPVRFTDASRRVHDKSDICGFPAVGR